MNNNNNSKIKDRKIRNNVEEQKRGEQDISQRKFQNGGNIIM